MKKYQNILPITILVAALLGMFGSLYFSTYGDPFSSTGPLEPCLLCWYSRIILYPIVPIAFVGILKKDSQFTDYILPLAIAGIILSIYHIGVQNGFSAPTSCSTAVPCSEPQVQYFGFITIPILALANYIMIGAAALINSKLARKKPE